MATKYSWTASSWPAHLNMHLTHMLCWKCALRWRSHSCHFYLSSFCVLGLFRLLLAHFVIVRTEELCADVHESWQLGSKEYNSLHGVMPTDARLFRQAQPYFSSVWFNIQTERFYGTTANVVINWRTHYIHEMRFEKKQVDSRKITTAKQQQYSSSQQWF